ncbi:c-type cytochrome [Heliorestis convoluta]|uniref:Cytochrome c, diheme subunit of cytochrome bc complex, PetA n=1 Tax=Heliorestis convoluta TaxID=356322 RepID=A0A5Q2N1N4_9FIRM|nr:c-type cytochrome [Heliorestis convoluta]QGG48727.1 Cytochrome c, diheme subunit of cytochrome bc complex, PetA [Heliorestis convoluta]
MDNRKLILFASSALLLVGLLMTPLLQAKGQDFQGSQIYKTYCYECHGVEGRGIDGLRTATLNNEGFLEVADDDYWEKTIRLGRVVHEMPGFGPEVITDRQLTYLVDYIRSWAPNVQPIEFSDEVIAGDPVKGKEYYGMLCAACHGPHGEGLLGPSLTDPAFLASASDNFILQSTIKGRPDTTMPGYPDSQDLRNVVAFLRTFEVELEDGELPEDLVLPGQFVEEETEDAEEAQ